MKIGIASTIEKMFVIRHNNIFLEIILTKTQSPITHTITQLDVGNDPGFQLYTLLQITLCSKSNWKMTVVFI